MAEGYPPSATENDDQSQGVEQGEVLERRGMSRREVQKLISIMIETAKMDDADARADMLGGVVAYMRQLGGLESGASSRAQQIEDSAQDGMVLIDTTDGPILQRTDEDGNVIEEHDGRSGQSKGGEDQGNKGGQPANEEKPTGDGQQGKPANEGQPTGDGQQDQKPKPKKNPEAQPAGTDEDDEGGSEDNEDSEEEKARKKKVEELRNNAGFMEWYKNGLAQLGDEYDDEAFGHLSMDRLNTLEQRYNNLKTKEQQEKAEEERKKKLEELKGNSGFMEWFKNLPNKEDLDSATADRLDELKAQYEAYEKEQHERELRNKLMSDPGFIKWARENNKIEKISDINDADIADLEAWNAEYEKAKLAEIQNELMGDPEFIKWAKTNGKIEKPEDLNGKSREELESLKTEYLEAKKKEALDRIKTSPEMVKWLIDSGKIKEESDLDSLSLDELKNLESEFVKTLNTSVVADVTLKNEGSERARRLAELEVDAKIAESKGFFKLFNPKHLFTKIWTGGLGKEVAIRNVQKEITRQIELSAKLEAMGSLSDEEQKELDELNKKRLSDPSWWGAASGDVSRFITAHMEAHDDWVLEDENMTVYKIIDGEVKAVKRVRGEDGEITEQVSDLGEKDGNVAEVMKGIQAAIQEYVESDDNDPNARDKLRETIARLKGSFTGRDDKFPFMIDNYMKIAENAKLRAKHENGTKNMLEGFTLIRGEMNRDANTESKSNLKRRAGDFAANHHARWIPEAVAVTAAVVAVSAGTSIARKVGTATGAAVAGALGGVFGAAAAGTIMMEIRHAGDLKNMIASQTREIATGAEAGPGKLDKKIAEAIEPLLYETIEVDGKEQNVRVTAERFTSELSQGADDLQAALDRLESDPSSILDNPEELSRIQDLADRMSYRSREAKLRVIEGRKNHVDLIGFSTNDLSVMENERLQVLLQADRVESLCKKLNKSHAEAFRDHGKELSDYERADEIARTQLFGGKIELPNGKTVTSKGVVAESRKAQRRIIASEIAKSAPFRFVINSVMSLAASEGIAEISKDQVSVHEALTGRNLFGRENNAGAADSLLTSVLKSKGVIPPEVITSTSRGSETFASEQEAREYVNQHGGGNVTENPQPDSITQGTSAEVGNEYGQALGGDRTYFINGTTNPDGTELGLSGSGSEWYVNGNFHGIASNGFESVNVDQAMANGEINLLVYLKGSKNPIEIAGQYVNGRYGFPTDGLPPSVVSAMEHGDMSMVQITQSGLSNGMKRIFASVPMGDGGGSGAIYDIHTPTPSTWTGDWVQNTVTAVERDTMVTVPPIITPVTVGGRVTRRKAEGGTPGEGTPENGPGNDNPGEDNPGDNNPGGGENNPGNGGNGGGHEGGSDNTGAGDGSGGVGQQAGGGSHEGGGTSGGGRGHGPANEGAPANTGEGPTEDDTENDDGATGEGAAQPAGTDGAPENTGAGPENDGATPEKPKPVTPETITQDGEYRIMVDYAYVHENHPELDGYTEAAVRDWNALTPERATEILNGGALGPQESIMVGILTQAGLIEVRKPAEQPAAAEGTGDNNPPAGEDTGEDKPKTMEELQAKYGFPITHAQTREALSQAGRKVQIDEAKAIAYLREGGVSEAVINRARRAIGRWNGNIKPDAIDSFMGNHDAGRRRDYYSSLDILREYGILETDR